MKNKIKKIVIQPEIITQFFNGLIWNIQCKKNPLPKDYKIEQVKTRTGLDGMMIEIYISSKEFEEIEDIYNVPELDPILENIFFHL